MATTIRIATRSSALALWQARHVAHLLRESSHDISVELVEVRTAGDNDRSSPLRQFGGTGVFTGKVQAAVLDGSADLAVHSLKDLPTAAVDGLELCATTERASAHDALVLPANAERIESLADMPTNARVGTGSPRRQAQLEFIRPDVVVMEIRGNVETRLRKLDSGEFDVIVLAEAGLARLSLSDRISLRLGPPDVFPAVGQGALGLECRDDDESTRTALSAINHGSSWLAIRAERAMLAELRAGCHAPVGVWTSITDERMELDAVLFSDDYRHRVVCHVDGAATDAESLGIEAARSLRSRLDDVQQS